MDRAVTSVDPFAAKNRHEKALADRNVAPRADEDGMGTFRADLPADKARLAYGVIDQIACQLNRAPTDGPAAGGVGALRADVFGDLFDQLLSTGNGNQPDGANLTTRMSSARDARRRVCHLACLCASNHGLRTDGLWTMSNIPTPPLPGRARPGEPTRPIPAGGAPPTTTESPNRTRTDLPSDRSRPTPQQGPARTGWVRPIRETHGRRPSQRPTPVLMV